MVNHYVVEVVSIDMLSANAKGLRVIDRNPMIEEDIVYLSGGGIDWFHFAFAAGFGSGKAAAMAARCCGGVLEQAPMLEPGDRLLVLPAGKNQPMLVQVL